MLGLGGVKQDDPRKVQNKLEKLYHVKLPPNPLLNKGGNKQLSRVNANGHSSDSLMDYSAKQQQQLMSIQK